MMYSQALRREPRGRLARTRRSPAPRVAVVVNANARGVKPAIIRDLGELLRDETLFVSRSLEQNRFIARRIVNEGYDVVLAGGGDGTLTEVVSAIAALRPARMPAFGVLRLGTGNAAAEALGAGRRLEGVLADIRVAHHPAARAPLPLLRTEGKLTPFAGVGLDALILEDYAAVKSRLARTPLRKLGEGGAGYALAITGRTIARYIREPRPRVVIRNAGAPARRIDLNGRAISPPVPRGGVLYEGPVTLAAASTVPFYGLGLRLFPQAGRRPDRFQLRVADVPLPKMMAHVPALFRGDFQHRGVHDYLCTAVTIESATPTPVQVGGDLIGERSRLDIGMVQLEGVIGAARAPAEVREALRRAAN